MTAGSFVPSSTVLWPHISTAFLERACIRGADASRMPTKIFNEFPALLTDVQANKLTTVKKCLNEVLKYGGPFNPRDLYPVRSNFIFRRYRRTDHVHGQYQLALFQIDSMRKDGRFIGVDGTIPEGQGIINANLSECHELVEMASPIRAHSNRCLYLIALSLICSSRSRWTRARRKRTTKRISTTLAPSRMGRRNNEFCARGARSGISALHCARRALPSSSSVFCSTRTVFLTHFYCFLPKSS